MRKTAMKSSLSSLADLEYHFDLCFNISNEITFVTEQIQIK